MPGTPLSEDEIVETLAHSRGQPTVVVEGDSDCVILRWIESRLGHLSADLLQCNGRTTLLKVFMRRNEFQDIPVVFLADRDM